jgi:hypothetical protein
MEDYYKRLNISDMASEDDVRSALSDVHAPWREPAEFVLLEPRRRKVYDRNRRLLVVIGQLRFELGLTFTRFWSRERFKDFWAEPAFVESPEPPPKKPVTKLMILGAFKSAGKRHVERYGRWWVGVVILVALLVVLLVIWRWAG